MEQNEQIRIIKDMQAVVAQMRIDDIEENPACEEEMFECDCCGKDKSLAGSVYYSGNKRLCNECVLLAEVSLALNKISNVQELIDNMEETRLEELCEFIKQNTAASEN